MFEHIPHDIFGHLRIFIAFNSLDFGLGWIGRLPSRDGIGITPSLSSLQFLTWLQLKKVQIIVKKV